MSKKESLGKGLAAIFSESGNFIYRADNAPLKELDLRFFKGTMEMSASRLIEGAEQGDLFEDGEKVQYQRVIHRVHLDDTTNNDIHKALEMTKHKEMLALVALYSHENRGNEYRSSPIHVCKGILQHLRECMHAPYSVVVQKGEKWMEIIDRTPELDYSIESHIRVVRANPEA